MCFLTGWVLFSYADIAASRARYGENLQCMIYFLEKNSLVCNFTVFNACDATNRTLNIFLNTASNEFND